MKRKCIAILILLIVIAGKNTSNKVFAKTIYLDTVLELAGTNNVDIKTIKMDLIKQNIEKNQALKMIKRIKEQENGDDFSFKQNDFLNEAKELPEEIDTLIRFPRIEWEFDLMNERLRYTENNLKYQIELDYLDVLFLKQRSVSLEEQLEESKKMQSSIMLKKKVGKATAKDLTFINKKVLEQGKQYREAFIEVENSVKKLEKAMGKTVGKDDEFGVFSLMMIDFEQLDREDLIKISRQRNFEIYEQHLKTKWIEQKVREIKKIYPFEFVSKVEELEEKFSEKKITVDKFYAQYTEVLEEMKPIIKTDISFNINFFEIQIPYKWYRTVMERDSVYFKDEEYALCVAIMDRETQKNKEKDAIKAFDIEFLEKISEIEENIKVYNELFLMHEENLEIYEKKILLQKIGKISFEELEKAKSEILDEEYQILLINDLYTRNIVNLELKSSGYLSESNSYVGLDVESSKKEVEKTNEESFEWNVKMTEDRQKFIFDIVAPKGQKITSYELFTDKNKLIGTRTAIGKSLVAKPVIFGEVKSFYLKLYEKEKLCYIAKISGDTDSGNLDLEKEEISHYMNKGSVVGSYKEIIREEKCYIECKLNIPIKPKGYGIYYEQGEVQPRIEASANIIEIENLNYELEKLYINLVFENTKEYKVGFENGVLVTK